MGIDCAKCGRVVHFARWYPFFPIAAALWQMLLVLAVNLGVSYRAFTDCVRRRAEVTSLVAWAFVSLVTRNWPWGDEAKASLPPGPSSYVCDSISGDEPSYCDRGAGSRLGAHKQLRSDRLGGSREGKMLAAVLAEAVRAAAALGTRPAPPATDFRTSR